MCLSPAATSYALMLRCLIDQRPSDAIQSFDCEIKTFQPENQPWQNYSSHLDGRLLCVIFICCILLEKTPRGLFEVCAETEGCREGT